MAVSSSSADALPAKPVPVRSTSSLTGVVDRLGEPTAEQVADSSGDVDVDAGVTEPQSVLQKRRAGHQPGRRRLAART